MSRLAASCACAAALTLPGAGPAPAATIYVDLTIAPASCTTYNVATRSCGGGTETAYRTMNGAGAVAIAGDVLLARAGTYQAQFAPSVSGTALAPITLRPYLAESVSVANLGVQALLFSGVSNWVVEGLTVDNVLGWARIVDATAITLRSNTFTRATATGTTGAIKIVRGGSHRVLDNTISDGNDNIGIVQSDRNLVEGNTITLARHTLWRILCGNENVIRDNYLSNPIQKIGEVLDCEGGSDVPFLLDATKRNVIEGNVFALTAVDDGGGPYAGIQYAGQEGIVRRNVFYDNQGAAIDLSLYSNEALHNKLNRIYHNVAYGNVGGVVMSHNPGSDFIDNVFTNNVLHRNTPMPLGWYDDTPSGSQVTHRTMAGFRMVRNDILGQSGGEPDVIFAADPPRLSLAQAQAQFVALYSANLELLPQFVDTAGRDFRLAPGSPLIDAGAFLTTAVGAGSGVSLPVADASYFHDGFGIAGVEGDLIQLATQTATARIVDIVYATDTLVLDQPLTWTAGLGVSLAYSGSAPDVGAFETGSGPGSTIFANGFEQ